MKPLLRTMVVAAIGASIGSEAEAQVPGRGIEPLQLRAPGILDSRPLSSIAARAERESDRLLAQAAARLRSALPMSDEVEKRSVLLTAEHEADSALTMRPTLEALYWRTAVRAMRADVESGGRQIELAAAVHEEALAILSVEPDHAGAHHLVGRLHAAVMRLGTVKRFVATRVLGGSTLSDASWESAEQHFRRALSRAPHRVEHKLELASVLIDTGREEEARLLLQEVISARAADAVGDFYQESARRRLAELRDAP